jgi:antitoxin ParD1/3/4
MAGQGASMPTSKTLNITLSGDLAQLVARKIASGEYANESEVISDGLSYLQDNEAALEHWLQTEVAASYDEVHADPSFVIPADEIMDRIRANYRRTKEGSTKDRR